jgi:fructose-1,6-bisphosphatase/inositol monophosphatase family enzyme
LQIQNSAKKIADTIVYPVSYASSSAANNQVALGHLAAYFYETPTKYDIAAYAVIIDEAGGKCQI